MIEILDAQRITQVARRLRALGSSRRLLILQTMENAPSPLSLGAIAEQMQISPSALGQQIRTLYAEGFVEVQEPSGDPFVCHFYRVNHARIAKALQEAAQFLNAEEIP